MFCRKRKNSFIIMFQFTNKAFKVQYQNDQYFRLIFKYKYHVRQIFDYKALLIDPENTQALLLRAIALGKLKAISECAVTYREATRINPYFYEAYKGLVETLLNLNHTKDAVQVATTAIKLLGSNHRTLAVLNRLLSIRIYRYDVMFNSCYYISFMVKLSVVIH